MAHPSWFAPDAALLTYDAPLPLDLPFTEAMAARWGVSRRTMRTLLARGLIRRVTRGVYAAAQAPTSPQFRAAALALVVSPGAIVTDRTAAWLHGIDLNRRSLESLMPPISVFLPPGTRSTRPGVLSGERRLLDTDITEIGGVRATTELRTACDLGRFLYRFDALAALDAFLRSGVDHDQLLTEISRFKHYRGVVQLRGLAPLADPRSESVGESWLRLFWYDAGLPAPQLQWWVCDDVGVPVFRLDLALPEVSYAAEYDGEQFHTADADREYDEVRRAWLDHQRSWHIEVFDKGDVFVRRADPIPRLQQGLVVARRRLALPTSYPTLPTSRRPRSSWSA